ncbi:hypothetical protein V490_08471 [Pseudogymnoascus sp. VKM F-3557]|nr:hypothetical protein V490_08471 [Pseudogymnoascus sp. VKM F-3557]
MWPNNNFGNKGSSTQNGGQDNDHQNNTSAESFPDNYKESEINQGSASFVSFSSLPSGFPVYPLFPFEYFQPPNSNYMGGYMPNMFQQMPGFVDNGFLQTSFTNPANSEEVQSLGSAAAAHPGVSALSTPSIQPTPSAQPIVSAKPTASMGLTAGEQELQQLRARLIKIKEERAKAKPSTTSNETGADTVDPTSQEMASLLRGSPPTPKKESNGTTRGSTGYPALPTTVEKGISTGNTGAKSNKNGTSVGGIAAEKETRENRAPGLIAASKAATRENCKPVPANRLPVSKSQPPSDAIVLVSDNIQSKGSQTKLNMMHAKPATSQVKASGNIEQNNTVSKGSQEKIRTEVHALEITGKGKLPSAPSVMKEQALMKSQSSTIMGAKKPAPGCEPLRLLGSNANANTIDKPKIDVCNRNKDNSSEKNNASTVHSPREDKHTTLEKVLLSNEDLRDWLKLTKWDDLAHRRRALERHRAIAAIDTEKARLLETVAKIAVLDKEKAKIAAEVTDDEDGFGDKPVEGPKTESTTGSIDSSESNSPDSRHNDKRAPDLVKSKKRSFSSFTNSNHHARQPNSRRSRAADTRRHSRSNTRKELFYQRHEERGRSRGPRDPRNYRDLRDISPDLRAFLERDDEREAEERRREPEFRSNHREEHWQSRGYRGQYRGRYRGRGSYDWRR